MAGSSPAVTRGDSVRMAGARARTSERDLVAALEREDLARLIGRGDLAAEPFENLAHIPDLLGVALGELAGPDPERILHADADVAAHRRSLRRDPHLRGAG